MSAYPAVTGGDPCTKRTRLNVIQSKNGCFTCRDRRKKCDERRPACRRCEAAGRVCEGYRSEMTVSAARLSQAEPRTGQRPVTTVQYYTGSSLTNAMSCGAPHTRYSWYGLVALTEEAFQNEFGIDAALWTTLVSRLYRISPAVHAAVACLGAAYERLNSDSVSNRSASEPSLEHLYPISLRRLQEEIDGQSCDPLPVFFASIIFAGVEALQGNQNNALMYVQGAFQVYTQYFPGYASSSSNTALAESEDQLAVTSIVQAFDVQIASYALARPLDLPPFSATMIFDRYDLAPLSTQRLRLEILALLHNCYHFAIQASNYKYVHYSHMPPDITVDQGRHITLLLNWINVLNVFGKQDFANETTPLDGRLDARQRCILSLRAQCLSSLIYLSTILCAYETNYDASLSYFDEIVSIAFRMLHQDGSLAKRGRKFRFRILSSLSQPLVFTAMKCRDPGIRRRAAALLAMTGKEGPWDAQVLCRVVARVIATEESLQILQSAQGSGDTEELHARNLSTLVSEQSRLHGCGIEPPVSPERINPNQQSVKRVVTVQLSRCVDVEKMVRSTEGLDPKAFEDKEHWHIWREDIEL